MGSALGVPDGTTIILNGSSTISFNAPGAGLSAGNSGSLTIRGTGSLEATSSTSYGINCGNLTMESGTLNTNGGSGPNSLGIQVFSGDFDMSGGTLNAIAGNATQASVGMRVNDLTMSGGTLNAIAGSATTASFGIHNFGNFDMTAGTLIAHSDNGATMALAMVVLGTVSTGNIPIKGYDGSAYTIDSSFKVYSLGNANVIMDNSDNIIYKAKIGTEPPAPVPTPTPTPTPSDGSSKQDTPTPAPAPVISPMDNKSSGTLNNAINAAANIANSDGKSFDVKLKNVSSFTKANAEAIIKKAKELGKPATVSSDIMSEDGKYVEVRVTLDPTLITKTVRLDGYIRESQIMQTASKFKKLFSNKIAVIHLAQEGKFGQSAKISAKVDLKGFNTSNLYLYSYDKKTNKYTLITSKDYKIDANGYLVFNTDFGGDIIISDGLLTPKGQK